MRRSPRMVLSRGTETDPEIQGEGMAPPRTDSSGEAHPEAARNGSGEATSLSLLARARANDATAWQRVMDLYRPLVLNSCTRLGVQAEDAEDVAQEVFSAAAAALKGFHHDRPGDTFRGWLRGITRNQVLMHFRRNQKQPRAKGGSAARLELENVPERLSDEPDEADEVSQLYRRALEFVRGEFTERLWRAFWLTAIEERLPAD